MYELYCQTLMYLKHSAEFSNVDRGAYQVFPLNGSFFLIALNLLNLFVGDTTYVTYGMLHIICITY